MSGHVRDRLSAFMDGELPRIDRAVVETHLRDCPECARHLEELVALDDQARALPVDAPEGYFEALPGRLRSRLERERRPMRWRPPVWSWAAAAALLLAVLTPLTYRRAAMPQSAPPAAVPPATVPPSAAPPAAFADRVPEGAETRRVEARPEPQRANATPAPPAAPGAGGPSTLAEEDRERLRALGYVEGNRDQQAAGTLDGKLRQEPEKKAPKPDGYAPPPADETDSGKAKQAKEQQARDTDSANALRKRAEADKTAPSPAQEVVTVTGDAPAVSTSTSSSRPPEGYAGGLGVGRKDEGARRQFADLASAPAPTTAAEARRLRDAWRALARSASTKAAEADEARVRAIEAGAAAYRLSHDAKDLVSVREEAQAYLRRPDAAQAERARALLETLPATP